MNVSLSPLRATPWRRVLAAALVAAGLQSAPPAQAKCTVEMMELPVRMEGTRAIATVGINGTQVPLIVDSGAFFSMLTEGTAAQLKLPLTQLNMELVGITGNYDDVHMTTVDHLQLLGATCATSSSSSAATNSTKARWA